MANYGTTPNQFKAELTRIQREACKIDYIRQKRKSVHNFSTGINKFLQTIFLSAQHWYYDSLHRIYNNRVAQFYEPGNNSLYTNSFYFTAYDKWPFLARPYLLRAEKKEISLIPRSRAVYLYERARLSRDKQLYLSTIAELDPVWEKNYRIKAVSEYCRLLETENQIPDIGLLAYLLENQPSCFLTENLTLPTLITITGASTHQQRMIQRMVRHAGFSVSTEKAFLLDIKILEDTLEVSLKTPQDKHLFSQVFHRKGTLSTGLSTDLSTAIDTLVNSLFSSPLGQ